MAIRDAIAKAASSIGLGRVQMIADQPAKVKSTEVIGVGGTAVYSGFIQENEKNPAVQGRNKYTTYADILANVGIAAASVRYFLNFLSRSKWIIEPADDSDEAKKLAEFFESVIYDMRTPWSRVVRRAAMYKFYGYNIQEWTAKKRDDGAIGLLDVEPRPQFTIERWDLDEKSNVLGVVQRSPQTQKEIYLPISKLVYALDDSLSDSPEGLGIFRNMVDTVDRLKRYEQLEGFGFETDLRGVPIARAPLTQLAVMVKNGEITKQQSDDILKPVRDFVSNHIKSPKLGMVIDSTTYRSEDAAASPSSNEMWSVDLLKTDSSAHEDMAKAIQRLVTDIARLVGTENILLGTNGSSGNRALSEDKSDNFNMIIESTLNELAETFERDLVTPVWDLNGFDPKLKPTLRTEAVMRRNVEELTSALKNLATAGAPLSINDPAINEVRQLLGLSPMEMMDRLVDEDDDMLARGKDNVDDIDEDDNEDEGVR